MTVIVLRRAGHPVNKKFIQAAFEVEELYREWRAVMASYSAPEVNTTINLAMKEANRQ